MRGGHGRRVISSPSAARHAADVRGLRRPADLPRGRRAPDLAGDHVAVKLDPGQIIQHGIGPTVRAPHGKPPVPDPSLSRAGPDRRVVIHICPRHCAARRFLHNHHIIILCRTACNFSRAATSAPTNRPAPTAGNHQWPGVPDRYRSIGNSRNRRMYSES